MSRVARAVVWLLAAAAAGGLGLIGYALASRPGVAPQRWSVAEQFSAHHVLVMHVETRHLTESKAIAQQLVEPLKSKYAEILIYYHLPGRLREPIAPRRVQWTLEDGFVETIYSPEERTKN